MQCQHLLPAQLLAHLYAKTDAASLATLRRELLRPPYTAVETAAGAAAGVAVVAGAASLPCSGQFCVRPVPSLTWLWWRMLPSVRLF